jgi:hypothetical protein
MKLNNFYVLVDLEIQQIIDKIQKLPENWKNIAGLSGLSDDELNDLTWANQLNLGWINIHSEKIKNFQSSAENLQLNKNTFKRLVSEIRKDEEKEPINYQGAKIKSDFETQLALFLLKDQKEINFKCLNGYYTFTSGQIIEICDIILNRIQYLFNREKEIYDQIDQCNSVCNFLSVNYDF